MIMSTQTAATIAATFVERLNQAIRVMDGLAEPERSNFTLNAWATRTPAGVCACIAGHCGLDPWFQERGLITAIEDESEGMGKVSVFPEVFFGTSTPFYPQLYRDALLETANDVSPDEATTALRNAIARFEAMTASADV
jgi:hypothetical protein